MDWHAPIDIYCERTDASFWSEPVNALSNAAFLAAALLAWRELDREGRRDLPAALLVLVVGGIGVGSFLFHTFANRWSGLADVVPIQLFMLGMFGLMLRRLLGWGLFAALAGAAGFLATGLLLPRTMASIGGAGALAGYGTGLLAMLALGGLALRVREEGVRRQARRVLLAAAVFALSLGFRSIDEAACAALPLGTHFLWHLLNAATLWLLLTAAIRLGARGSDAPTSRHRPVTSD